MGAHTVPAPAPPGDRSRLPLGLTRIVHRRFPAGTSRIDDAFSRRHFADLTGIHGVTHRPDIAERARGNTFTTMTRRLLTMLAPQDLPVDLAVVAHVTPDLDCRLAAVTCLSEVLPGRPQVFTVSDCGSAAAFTALHIAGRYAARHDHHRVAVFVLDQATLPYETGEHLAGDAGVALVLGGDGPADGIRLRQLAGIAPREVRDAVRGILDELGCDASLPVVTGPGTDPIRDLPRHAGRIVRSAAGYPATAALAALATDQRRREGREERIAVADYEPRTGDLAVCLLERGTG
ncbi:hypothetical protein [Streptomyces sp. NPDC046261]|uniref:hypothetical protein n=1 Tax=Streptomyces sp. NPDC046261 TaxID=3157200 RepID=UPI0033DA3F6D